MKKKSVKKIKTTGDAIRALESRRTYISAEARKIFETQKRALETVLIIELDETILAMFAQAKAEISEINKIMERGETSIRVSDNGAYYINPYLTLRSMLQKTLLECSARLGLSPADRARMKAQPTEGWAASEMTTGRKKSKTQKALEDAADKEAEFC